MLLVFFGWKALKLVVGLILSTSLLEMLFSSVLKDAYRSISQLIYRTTEAIEGKGVLNLGEAALN